MQGEESKGSWHKPRPLLPPGLKLEDIEPGQVLLDIENGRQMQKTIIDPERLVLRSSNEIFQLLRETSQVEFKLVFPVRLTDKKRGSEEHLYTMNYFSRVFELGYVDKEKRKDEIVNQREYTVVFNTLSGGAIRP